MAAAHDTIMNQLLEPTQALLDQQIKGGNFAFYKELFAEYTGMTHWLVNLSPI